MNIKGHCFTFIPWNYFRNIGLKIKSYNKGCSQTSYHLGIPRALGAVCPEGDKDQILISYYKSQYLTLCLSVVEGEAVMQGIVFCLQKHNKPRQPG